MDLLEDHQSPTYILMDEDDYESIVAQMKHSVNSIVIYVSSTLLVV